MSSHSSKTKRHSRNSHGEFRSSENSLEDVPIVSSEATDVLSERELLDFREHKRDVLEWAANVGKDPKKAEGYATSTVRQLSYQLGSFYRWLWTEKGGYTTNVSPADADNYMEAVAYRDTSNAHKATAQKCLKRLLRYRSHRLGESHDWEPERTFSEPQTNPRDFLTPDERTAIREAALEYGSVPAYNGLSPEQRDRWKGHLAQRFDKPKRDVGPEDFAKANGWKFPSLVWASLDTGLRPIEVERATTAWVDVDNKLLRIPKEESTKNRENWTVAVTDRTASALERWLTEREQYEKYQGTDVLWLTREGNPYGRQALRRLLHRLCDVAGIAVENRQMSWYTIRHSVGTAMTREEDLKATKDQLRHKSVKTSMKYDQVPVGDRREALDKMG